MERERGTFIMETLGLIIVLPWLCPVSLLRLHYCDDDRWRYQLNPYVDSTAPTCLHFGKSSVDRLMGLVKLVADVLLRF